MISCPVCTNKIVWRNYFPKKEDYSCVRCGYSWVKEMLEQKSAYGICIGDWTKEEIEKLDEELCYVHPDLDWKFFKGKSIFTAWQSSVPKHFIKAKTFDEILYWVSKCSQNNNTKEWYQSYKANL